MKIKSSNPLIITHHVKKVLPFFTKTLGYQVKHNLSSKYAQHLILERNNNRIDLVVSPDANKEINFKQDKYGIRVDVNDIDDAIDELENKKFKVFAGPYIIKKTELCFMKDTTGLIIGLISHIK